MIISASRRTDIPAFYTPWFMNRIRAGYCLVPNPFNAHQITRVSLLPEDVTAIVFWTRHAAPLLPFLGELDARGFRYYFQYTLMDNPRYLEPHTPVMEAAVLAFRRLADSIGAERVIWRYDPVCITPEMDSAYHCQRYEAIAARLEGYTRRSVVSFVDYYPKSAQRYRDLERSGLAVPLFLTWDDPRVAQIARHFAGVAQSHGMELLSCAELIDLRPHGIMPGKCIDDVYLRRVFGIQGEMKKDASQRHACCCVQGKDIGAYDSCLFGCRYCYAVRSFDRARRNHDRHDPLGESLLPVRSG